MTSGANPAPSPARLGRLVLRADASTRIGTGHVMRCLALAQAWMARGGEAILVSSWQSPLLRERVRAASVSLVDLPGSASRAEDLEQVRAIATGEDATATVVDGYGFDAAYQRELKGAGARLAVFDDFVHTDHYYADWVINPNLDAALLDYPRETYTRLLLGTPYAILRPEFRRWRTWARACPERATRILVTLGGSDPDNITALAIQALEALALPDVDARVIVGASNPRRAALELAVAGARTRMRLEYDVRDMAEHMAWADLAVAAGGTTCWELAFMGLPSAIIVLADNQARSAEALARHGGARLAGNSQALTVDTLASVLEPLLDDRAAREGMAVTGRRLVDGLGADRVIDAIAARSGQNG